MGAVSISKGFDAGLRFSTIATAFFLLLAGRFAYSGCAGEGCCGSWRDLEVHDGVRDRIIPIRIYLPEDKADSPLVLFSHGLGGSRRSFSYLAKAWRELGFSTVFIQHPGSDEDMLKGVAPHRVEEVMREAAGRSNFTLRIADIPAVMDQLHEWSRQPEHPLYGRIRTKRVGVAGHSFGAMTAQALGGQRFGFGIGRAHFADDRIVAALMLSPSPPIAGTNRMAFGRVDTPWMLISGTDDYSPIARFDAEERREVFRYLPDGGKYKLVFEGAGHGSYDVDGRLRSRDSDRFGKAIAAVSGKFWQAWLEGDKAARKWLESDEPKSLMEPEDSWLFKP